MIVISADGHAGADLLDYRPYLEARYREEFDAWAKAYVNPFADLQAPEAERNWNSGRRLRELEQDGIVAEVLFPNTIPPFFPSANLTAPHPTAAEYELRWAGCRAHNRWLADFCAEAPGRRAGVAEILLNDVDDAVAEIRWAHGAGLRGGVLLPGVAPGAPVPPLHDPVYEPIWRTCAELGMPVNHHGGTGAPGLEPNHVALAIFIVEVSWYAHRALWHLILGGVFERHPDLRLVLTEQGSDWIPGVLDTLDYYFDRFRSGDATAEAKFGGPAVAGLSLRPSEYFARNCMVGATFMKPSETPLRHAIGVDRLMWGSDFPHDEGTFPYSREALRRSFHDVPADELHRIVAANAARVYGFDLDALRPVADRVGLTEKEIARPLEVLPADATSPVFNPRTIVRAW
ncbi:amidohydrolase family protein [Actinomadura rupiterrae]|uniref:amidohydrolase family protein n=1 Tax=Actinomadura rupiterrae TaxID=559627 RepID=UPI0020A4231C|nr:amidohydrolase family protein [Actinomadura rupiterrae]MCP2337046.1 putative TIM-barrel fold metal-dependent hydrolase [Actinomadura rupiterrae]